jgi:hypothetical protein
MFDPLIKLWADMRRGNVAAPEVAAISRFTPKDSAGYAISRDQMYFEIRVNELHLILIEEVMLTSLSAFTKSGEQIPLAHF